MLMKWEDLEVGDKVKIHPEILKYWRERYSFMEETYEKPHKIFSIEFTESRLARITINFGITIEHIIINLENDCERYGCNRAPFFEVVKLKKD